MSEYFPKPTSLGAANIKVEFKKNRFKKRNRS